LASSTRDVLTNYPLLPRVLNKLAGAINDEAFSTLTAKVRGGEKPQNVSKDFLRQNKFI
jgi:glycine betaine/choline ABC-type transport system substrate-binding protein